MIEKISNVKIKGGYFDTEVDLPVFAKSLNIVYGRNGSGKSTISRAIKEYANLKDEDESKFSVNFDGSIDKDKIYVFNEDFVREKVLVNEEGVGTIVMLGHQVEVDRLIEKEKQELETLQKQHELLTRKEEEYNDKKNEISPKYHYKYLHDSLEEWASMDSKIRNSSAKINSKINERVIADLCSCSEQITVSDTVAALRDRIKGKYQLFQQTEDAVPLFWILEEYELPMSLTDMQALLDKQVEKPELSDRDKIIIDIANGKYGKYVNEAENVFSDVELNVCPLCQRVMSVSEKAELEDRIKSYFNKEVDNYKKQLTKLLGTMVDLSPTLPTFQNGINSEATEMAIEAIRNLNKVLGKIRNSLEYRMSNVFALNTFKLSSLEIEKAVKEYNNNMNLLHKKVSEYNLAIKNHTILKNELLRLNNKLAYVENKVLFNQYNQAVANQTLNTEKLNDNRKAINTVKKKVLDLEQRKRQVKIALDFINRSLRYIFYDNDRLVLEQGDGCYRLKSKGHDVHPKDVSLGERNIIGLCYFFASLFEGKEDEDKYSNELLLVIDDPVSSFDFENKVGVISFLRWQLDKIKHGNGNSKTLILTHDLQVLMDLQKVSQSTAANTSYFLLEQKVIHLFNGKISHEYNHLLSIVYKFASDETAKDEDYSIGNTMRRVLEAFFSFNYSEGFSNVKKLDELLGHLDAKEYFKNSMMRLVLHGESHYEERIKTLANPFDFFSITEKHRTAKDVLCLLYNLSDAHIKAILGSDALQNIKKWNEAIEKL